MILTLMLIILTATLVIVIIGFVMDRIEIRKLKGGMRTLNKRIKRLERTNYTMEGCYVDKADTETQEADGGDVSSSANDKV